MMYEKNNFLSKREKQYFLNYITFRPFSISEALHLVSTAAKHANDAMKRIEKFKKLLEVQESLGGTVDLVSPTRELLKEGKMVKISARSGDHQDRYLFLVSFSIPNIAGGVKVLFCPTLFGVLQIV